MKRKPFALPIALLLFWSVLYSGCDDLSGNYNMNVVLELRCPGGRTQTIEEGFVVTIKDNDGNIDVEPASSAATNLLSGSGTLTTETVMFDGNARTSFNNNNTVEFKFSGDFEGKLTSASSYKGEVRGVTGTYGNCQIVGAEFLLTKI